ncbi:MAG: glycosyltransferase [Actinomycetota bacterium]|nr:glycosyltransferase [Actinomycetota bacterium]
MRVVQRTIIGTDQELDTRPLYVSGLSTMTGGAPASRQSGAEEGWGEDDTAVEPTDDGADAGGFVARSDRADVVVTRGRRITFGTYFNAFPASYWRRWTVVDKVTLCVRVQGEGTVVVYRSTSKGHVQRVTAETVRSHHAVTMEVPLTLQPFIDGGWYWFDLEAGDGQVRLESAEWVVDTDGAPPGRMSIGITTFNRPEFCVDQLIALGNRPDVLAGVDEIFVVDQGTDKVSDHGRYEQAKVLLGDRLRLIEQGNLGGSGGFSRAMMETVAAGSSDYCLLLDDDVVCEPEGILRAVAFADLAKRPTMVGGQMFSLYDRSVLHAFGETVQRYRWFWGPAPNTYHGHNFAHASLLSTPWLHRRVDVDYNGWWMCLIPTRVIRHVGLALPMFIKWDDAEFGLRAQEAGYPTVTLPGVAVWHVPWHEKDDTIDWQAYFHRRNRIVAALLHSPYEHGGRMVMESFETQIRHLLSMQYGPAQMGLMAIEDILDGPQRMHRDVRQRLPELRELRKSHADSQMKSGLDAFPPARRHKPPRRGKEPMAPRTKAAKMAGALASVLRQVEPVRETARRNPEINVPHMDSKWWLLAQFDSALVSSADGTSAAWYRRDPRAFRRLLRRSVIVHSRLRREWPRLVEQYRQALPELVSEHAWRETIEASTRRRDAAT